jgi:hypothetical protein
MRRFMIVKRIVIVILWALTCVAAPLPDLALGEGNGAIQGRLYISPAGDLSYDVMVGRAVEVVLPQGDGALEAELVALKERWLSQLWEQKLTVDRARGEFFKFQFTDKAQEKRDTLGREIQKMTELREVHEKEINTQIATYVLRKTQTDQEGKFRFEGLSPGRYLLHARFQVLRTHYRYSWLSPVKLQEGEEQEIHLNKPTAARLYYGE